MQKASIKLAIAAMVVCAAPAFAQKPEELDARNRGLFVDAPAPLGALAGGSSKDAAARKRGGFQPGSVEFLRFAKLEAQPQTQESGAMDMRRWTLSALVDKGTGSVDFYVHYYEVYSAPGWKTLGMAQTDAGEALRVGRLTARMLSCRNGCSFSEELFIDLPPAMVEQARAQPLRIQLWGPGGSPVLIEVGAQVVGDLVAKAGLEAAKYRKAVAAPVPAAAPSASAQAPAIPPLVADELQKLARLRADGTLTEQEFQNLKARLLAR